MVIGRGKLKNFEENLLHCNYILEVEPGPLSQLLTS
jgi:hypothetical protein